MSKYLEFEEIKIKGKTKKFEVYNEKEDFLGSIEWHNSWRKYTYVTYPDYTFYDSTCLKEISTFLDKLNKEHKERIKDE